MESPTSLPGPSQSGLSSRSRSNTKLVDDVTSLTSFNPFSEEDENDQSSYALVSSLFSKLKSTFTDPLSQAVAVASGAPTITSNGQKESTAKSSSTTELRRPSNSVLQHQTSNVSSRSSTDRHAPLTVLLPKTAPPLVSLTPVVSEAPSFNGEYDRPPSRGGLMNSPAVETPDGGAYGTAIPGFPIQDDARSIRTTMSVRRSDSVSKVMRRIRGEGLSKDYWMDDENCKECYDCKSVFTTWRRKHHCRICGQIFCSRCASNIIKGSRFGHDGMLRVCNLCLEKLQKGDQEDEDDRRSVTSAPTSAAFAAHQFGMDAMSFGLGHHPQSPFAAAQLFGRSDEPYNLFSIAEARNRRAANRSDDSGLSSPARSMSPDDLVTRDAMRKSIAPFRRGVHEDEKDVFDVQDASSERPDQSPRGGTKTPVDFPITVPVNVDGTSSIQFPGSSPENAYSAGIVDSPGPHNALRSRYNSYAGYDDPGTPFIRSRVQSRLTEYMIPGEPAWRQRRESTAYAQELNLISMFHLRIMLRQMLTKEEIPNVKEWEETLLKLALRIARELTFTAYPQRQGADMDVRRYVKIKKLPGGTPQDSEYVDGAVITKNVAHKQMSRTQRNPRVMLVTFPLEFHRVEGQYMHFGQIVRQEKEYLGNLASRIAALRPHVLLVEKSVSRLALDALAKHRIAVARSVKGSAVQFVARMTQADVFSSIDKLALEPRLGHASNFRIQTFDHPLIPGRRKTFMRFEGCSRDMGCTIIVRGGDIEVLRRIKKVTRFLAFIVRNLKLETHLWKDSLITLPPLSSLAVPSNAESTEHDPFANFAATFDNQGDTGSSSAHNDDMDSEGDARSVVDEDAEQLKLSRRIQESLEPYLNTFISVSATLRFPPPYPIKRMKELDDELIRAKQAWEDEVIRREEKVNHGHQQEMTITPASFQDELKAQIEALPALHDLSKTPKPGDVEGSSGSDTPSSYFDGKHTSTSSMSTMATTSLTAPASPALSTVAPDETRIPLRSVADIALESHYGQVKAQHEEQRRVWEWYLRKNRDDFVVEKYQCISLWEFTLPIAEYERHRACFPPKLKYVTFYGEGDCTLGQFIDKSIVETVRQFLDPKAVCSGKGCNQPLARHCKVYVHNETRLFVGVEQWDGQIKGQAAYAPSPDLITTWSVCRKCGSVTPFIPISQEMQRYSFAKFLELHFYPADVQLVQGAGCQHNIYRDHVRYFAFNGMSVRFQADPITLHEVVYPPMRIRVRPETLLELKNTDYERLMNRNTTWYTALIHDLRLTEIDAATGDEEADAQQSAEINALIVRAETERNEIARRINKVYKESSPTDTLALNEVRAYRQDKIVAWQQEFDGLPKPRVSQVPWEKGGRRVSAFGTVRAMWPRKHELSTAFDQHAPSSSVSEAEEVVMPPRRLTGDSLTSTSSASEASESDVGDGTLRRSQLPSDNELVSTEDTTSAPVTEQASTSDPDSDSTIGAVPGEVEMTLSPSTVRQAGAVRVDPAPPQRVSRLPRRSAQQPSVAELVKKYQEYLPPQGVQELAKTALPPRYPESDQEFTSQPIRTVIKTKPRGNLLARKASTSDFEHSYAANIAPRYLARPRRHVAQGTRAPGGFASSLESGPTSRRTSPDKRPPFIRTATDTTLRTGRTSPPPVASGSSTSQFLAVGRGSRLKAVRGNAKDKAPSRPTSAAGPKSTLRRITPSQGSKVSNIAKHFERLSKENERSGRQRYAVIRGRRPRPVASARARVEVLESVQDVIRDESESSDSSSEADDEGGGDEEDVRKPPEVETKVDTTVETPTVVVEREMAGGMPSADPSAGVDGAKHTGQLVEVPRARDIAQDLPSFPPSPILSGTPMTQQPSPTHPFAELDMGPPGAERHSILKALSGFWPQQFPQPRSRMEMDADDPMADPEHIFRESSMVVRTDEPTSIIALALNSPQYREMLGKSRAEKRQAREPKLTESGEVFMPDDRSVAESTSTWGVVNVEVAEGTNPTEEMRVPSSKLPWQISFESGGLTISCTVLYPEQFDALRRTYDCEKSMIESLARCIKWNASGGKSGSAFLKTRDDRFIAKELSKAEMQTMESFGPAYFDYMSSAVTAKRPTLLAKVFGCYKIAFRKTKDNGSGRSKSLQMNLLVMENLFYDRRFSKIYDLKGSTRNRHVQSTGRENEVLLDENLVEVAHLVPFYLREHSKRILRGALYNDSKFLADINVMDYSLVVGVDSERKELVVGIVDYIRTYTWDKKLESWVKDLGAAGKGEPTIITPKQYRQRFLSAMERYFPLVPDRWMKQKDTPEEEGDSLLDLWPDW
ncbi:hypothetical protein GLOTRDRAFT_134891 [Gloeophyllum trabeum ATCC 11539]|uniref:1-phosphatidylinositol-3-phosphate 5-kinase n=1 Tax=Gloeophyllum trabeum (strain ATCC 11539 / FP-39264 / Madison 617) TaxID=670483 RepID=S7RYW0_GLOTA|nr:uncharacterized protein GLOTRDRAFT_134891 [Gloeophyllum trabeum ATCC 11539]EPQ60145.1 hypothetical protein GLOTRDRAFT_134891 [Gloeophyllum trabeum ATCC 11539]